MATRKKSVALEEAYQERLKFTCNRIRDEDRLINDRFSWLLNSQSIFFAAYAFLLNQPPETQQFGFVIQLIPVMALGICVVNYGSILAAVLAIYRFCEVLEIEYPDYSKKSQLLTLGPAVTHVLGQASPIFIPMGFLVAWMFFIFSESILMINMVVSIGIGLVLLVLLWIRFFPFRRSRLWW